MRSLQHFILNNGINPDFSDSLIRNIKITNVFNVIFLLLVIPFTILFHDSSIAVIFTTLPIWMHILSFILIRKGIHKAGRFIFAITTPTAVFFVAALIYIDGGTEGMAAKFLILGTIILPFLVFDFKEWKYIISVIIIDFFCVFSFDYVNMAIPLNITEINLDTPSLRLYSLATAFFMFTGVLLYFKFLLEKYTNTINQTLIDTEIKNKTISKQNEKLNFQKEELSQQKEELYQQQDEISSQNCNLEEMNQDLSIANQKANMASQSKSMFLANMSHEIRTPLNGIIGMVNILKNSNLTKSQKEHLEIVEVSGTTLLSIINDILDFSKIEAGQVELENIDFNLFTQIENIRKLLFLKADEKGLKLNVIINKDVPKFVKGDPVRLKQIILNLTNNAIKFTAKGKIEIKAKMLENNSIKTKLLFEVTDTGIGIAKDKVKTVFESFSQAGADINRKYGGTGLGLAISTQLANLMGGEIGLDSELGKGSTFWFTVVFEIGDENKIQKNDETETSTIEQKQLKILLVEDNLINQKVAKFNFNKLNHHVTVADNGQVAVDLFNKEKFDVIFMDIQMPVMNGYDATLEIRKIEKEKNISPGVKIIAMTANAFKSDKEKCFDIGMNGFISKPFKEQELRDVLKE